MAQRVRGVLPAVDKPSGREVTSSESGQETAR